MLIKQVFVDKLDKLSIIYYLLLLKNIFFNSPVELFNMSLYSISLIFLFFQMLHFSSKNNVYFVIGNPIEQ